MDKIIQLWSFGPPERGLLINEYELQICY